MNAPPGRLLRLSSIIKPDGPIPVSRSSWWAGVKAGRYPQPVKLGARITAWKEAEIQRLVDDGVPATRERS
ncbi:helix-turn-helix transcriptional regulator [Bradyrhizobium sp. HKCCYLS2058]|uniref:helix-turn-helix transcriptional regulator n=1 Tax=unclassified Bradyrhizobium TaxID=2631580 RepID=UPI003EC0D05E